MYLYKKRKTCEREASNTICRYATVRKISLQNEVQPQMTRHSLLVINPWLKCAPHHVHSLLWGSLIKTSRPALTTRRIHFFLQSSIVWKNLRWRADQSACFVEGRSVGRVFSRCNHRCTPWSSRSTPSECFWSPSAARHVQNMVSM